MVDICMYAASSLVGDSSVFGDGTGWMRDEKANHLSLTYINPFPSRIKESTIGSCTWKAFNFPWLYVRMDEE